jgi:transposase InsO family protein
VSVGRDDLADLVPSRLRHPAAPERPKSSYARFEADQPNERWQADITHWKLIGGTEVEILDVIDDHSRFLIASDARQVFKAADVVASFHEAAAAHGFPASVLTDNGAVFTASSDACSSRSSS